MIPHKLSVQDRNDLTAFLRELIQIPSPSTQEGALAARIAQEMTRLGFQDVHTDAIGNVSGRIGPKHGPTLMLNGHMDTVQVCEPKHWSHDPFGAKIEGDLLYGLGACDMKGGLAAMIYGAKLMHNTGFPLNGNIVVACVVQEEQCEGVGSRVLIEESGIRPEWVILGEPTDLKVSRGQRGRLEMRLTSHGRSAHAANPQLGENAIYIAARLVFGLELLADQLGEDDFLGHGTLTVTDISSRSSSRNAVPDRCELIIDRRLTLGENEIKALSEVQRTIAREGVNAEVEVTSHQISSYTGYTHQIREYYPAWVIAEDHPLVVATVRAAETHLKQRPQISCWNFSTEGVYTAGEASIPTVGFGPGKDLLAHTPDEYVSLTNVYTATKIYAQLAADLLVRG